MIAPSFWIDPKTGNDYMLTVQYPEHQIRSFDDLRAIPVHGQNMAASTRLDAISTIRKIKSPTEVDHYQLRRVIDIYVQPLGEDLGRIATAIDQLTAHTKLPDGVTVTLRGLVQGMRQSFQSFGIGLVLSVVLLYLILVAQFKSFMDPLLILTAVPPGLTGALLILYLTGTTMNVMSLMGLMILIGMTVSDSILIVEFTRHLRGEGMTVRQAVVTAARVRLRPVLMTSLATIIGLLPMALKLGAGSESYAPLARAVLGGMSVSLMMTVIMVPAAYYVAYRRDDAPRGGAGNVRVCDSQSVLHCRDLPDHRGGRCDQPETHAGGHVPVHEYTGGSGRHVLFGHAAGADRDRHHQPVRTLLYAGCGYRAHRIALASRGERDQSVLSAGHRSGFGGHYHFQPGDGAIAPAAAGHAAAGRAQIRCFEPARLPGHVQGARSRRNPVAGPGSVSGAQPDRGRPRRQCAAAFRRQIPPDHGVRGPLQAGSPPVEPHGRGAQRERFQPHPAGGRCSGGAAGLQHLHQQPAPLRERDQPAAGQDGRPVAGPRG